MFVTFTAIVYFLLFWRDWKLALKPKQQLRHVATLNKNLHSAINSLFILLYNIYTFPCTINIRLDAINILLYTSNIFLYTNNILLLLLNRGSFPCQNFQIQGPTGHHHQKRLIFGFIFIQNLLNFEKIIYIPFYSFIYLNWILSHCNIIVANRFSISTTKLRNKKKKCHTRNSFHQAWSTAIIISLCPGPLTLTTTAAVVVSMLPPQALGNVQSPHGVKSPPTYQ